MTFGNRTLSIHLVRGVLGMAAFVAAFRGYDQIGWPALLLLAPSLWLFKGCPMCWTVGLFETAAYRIFASTEKPPPV